MRLPQDEKDLAELCQRSGPRDILTAIHEKYVTVEEERSSAMAQEDYWGGKRVEKVGFEKIEQKQKYVHGPIHVVPFL